MLIIALVIYHSSHSGHLERKSDRKLYFFHIENEERKIGALRKIELYVSNYTYSESSCSAEHEYVHPFPVRPSMRTNQG